MRGEPEPAELLEDSQEAYFAEHPASGGGAVYLSLFGALALAAALLPIVRVDIGARARGLLRPGIEQHRVSAGAAGIVERVEARLGARVRAGDPLLALRDDAGRAGLAVLDSSATVLDERAAELEALLSVAAGLASSENGVAPRDAPPSRAAPAAHTRGRFRGERDRLLAEWSDLAGELEAARAETARAAELAGRGLVSPAELERAQLRLRHARAAPVLAAARQREAWTAELEQLRARRRELAGERARLLAMARLYDVRAPVDGTLEAVAALSPGSRVNADQELAVISPDAPLVAESWLDSREVGRVRPGMRVRLLVDAFDHHQWGALPAAVVDVGRDMTVVDGRPLFRVRCLPLRRTLRRPDGAIARPDKGMAVTVVFALGRRTLLHLLWDRAAEPEAAAPVATGA